MAYSAKLIYGKVAKLATGGFLSLVINAAAYPVLTLFYSPEEYGEFSVFLLFSVVFSASSIMKFELIIPVVSDVKELGAVVSAAAYNLVIVSAVSCAASLFYFQGGENLWLLAGFVVLCVL